MRASKGIQKEEERRKMAQTSRTRSTSAKGMNSRPKMDRNQSEAGETRMLR